MTDNANQQLLVSIDTDRAKAQQTAQTFAAHRADVQQTIRAYQDLRDATSKLGDIRAFEKEAAAVADLRQQFIAAADAAEKLNTEQSKNSGLSSSALRSTGRAFDALGLQSIGRPLIELSAIKKIEDEFNDLSKVLANVGNPASLATSAIEGVAGEMGVMATAGGLAVVAVAAIALAVTNFVNSIKDGEANLASAITANQKLYDDLASGMTSQQARDRVNQLQNALPVRQAQAQKAQEELTRGANQFGFSSNTARELLDKLPGMKELYDNLDKAKKALDDTNNAIGSYTGALNSNDFAANDAAAAEQKLQAARDQAAADDIQQARQTAQLVATGTSKGVEARISEIEAELNATFDKYTHAEGLGLSDAETNKLFDSLVKLQTEESNLQSNILPLIKAREAEAERVKETEKALKSYEAEAQKLNTINDEIARMQTDRAAQVKREQEDDVRNAQRAAVEKDYAARISEAKREESEQTVRDKLIKEDSAAQTKHDDALLKIDNNYFDAELKAYAAYAESEKQLTDRADLQKLRDLEDAQMDLRQAAARGDVAGFVERSNQAKAKIARETQDADLAAQQRQADYEKEIQESRDARQKQIDDLESSFDKEREARQTAAAERIADIETQGQDANTKSAQLEQELNDIREQWRRDDLQRQRDLEESSYQDRLNLQEAKQQEILAKETDFYNQWLALIGAPNDVPGTPPPVGTGEASNVGRTLTQDAQDQIMAQWPFPQFASGIDDTGPNSFFAKLDPHEAVLNERAAEAWRGGFSGQGGGDTYQITIQNTVGDIATKSMLDQYQNETVQGVKQAVIQSKGRGRNG